MRGNGRHIGAIDNAPARRLTKEKAMTIRARLHTTTHLVALLIAAAVIAALPFGAAAALRSGIACFL
jgi:hypothetical protein